MERVYSYNPGARTGQHWNRQRVLLVRKQKLSYWQKNHDSYTSVRFIKLSNRIDFFPRIGMLYSVYTVRCTRNGHGIHGKKAASTATVVNRTRYAERLLPLGRHARNGHIRRQQATTKPSTQRTSAKSVHNVLVIAVTDADWQTDTDVTRCLVDYVQRSSSSLYRRLRYRNVLITLHYIVRFKS